MREKHFKDLEEDSIDNRTLLGTADYISPEMILDNHCGYEGDLWALGISLFIKDVLYTSYFIIKPLSLEPIIS